MDSHLIMTMIHRLHARAVEPFFASLRETNFKGDVVVFASAIDRDSASQLRAWGASVREFSFPWKHVRNRLAKPWPLWKAVFASPLPDSAKRQLARSIFHLFYRRHLLYRDYLTMAGQRYDRILLTDCRDVFFQGDPFAWTQSKGVHVFLEAEDFRIKDCPHHTRWITSQFGPNEFQELGDKIISCAGTVFGDRQGLQNYLEKMLNLSMRARSLREFDGDQGLHNFLVYHRLIDDLTIHENLRGPVLTLGRVPIERLTIDRDGKVRNPFGEIPPVLHQYDRLPELQRILLERLNANA